MAPSHPRSRTLDEFYDVEITLSDGSGHESTERYFPRAGALLITITVKCKMRKTTKSPGEKIVKEITRATRKRYSSEERIWIVLDGLYGEDSIAELIHPTAQQSQCSFD